MINFLENIINTLYNKKIAFVGNNDGPLRLYNALGVYKENIVFIGLQKKSSYELAYTHLFSKMSHLIGFDDKSLCEFLKKEVKPDVVINIFCNFKFKKLLKHFDVFNLHLSYLPFYRGRHPLHWAIINGEKNHGITFHKMDLEFDNGEILWQEKLKILFGDSAKTLRERLLLKFEASFESILKKIFNDNYQIIKNSNRNATFAPRRFPKDNEIILPQSSIDLMNFVNALRDDVTCAYFRVNNKKKYVRLVRLLDDTFNNHDLNDYSNQYADILCSDNFKVRLIFKKKIKEEKS